MNELLIIGVIGVFLCFFWIFIRRLIRRSSKDQEMTVGEGFYFARKSLGGVLGSLAESKAQRVGIVLIAVGFVWLFFYSIFIDEWPLRLSYSRSIKSNINQWMPSYSNERWIFYPATGLFFTGCFLVVAFDRAKPFMVGILNWIKSGR